MKIISSIVLMILIIISGCTRQSNVQQTTTTSPGQTTPTETPGSTTPTTTPISTTAKLYIGNNKGTIYYYDGSEVKDLIDFNNSVKLMKVYNNKLYVNIYVPGHSLDVGAISHLYSYNGSTWTDLGTQNFNIYSMEVYNNKLYVAGVYNNFGSISNYFLSYDGSNWTDLKSPGSYIGSMVVYNNKLYVSYGYHVKSYDGSTWGSVGDPYGNTINSMEVYNNKLYAGGFGKDSSNGCIQFYDGSTWTDIKNPSFDSINSIMVYNNKLFISDIGGEVYHYDGSTWKELGYEDGSTREESIKYDPINSVTNFAVYDGKLYLGSMYNIYSFDGSMIRKVGNIESFVTSMVVYDPAG